MPIKQSLKHCLFCQIIQKIHPSFILAETDHSLAILDIFPFSNGHTLILSKRCVPNLKQLQAIELLEINQTTQTIVNLIEQRLNAKGFNILNNYNQIAGQIIDHYHLHVIPKYDSNSGFESKKIIDPTNPVKDIKVIWKELK